jgi:hypothetical protein
MHIKVSVYIFRKASSSKVGVEAGSSIEINLYNRDSQKMNWIELVHDAGSCSRFDISVLETLSIVMRKVKR